MLETRVILVNEYGLQAHPASIFVQEAKRFHSDIEVVYNRKRYNGKSIMSMLSMGAMKGAEVTLRTEGDDEAKALAHLAEFIRTQLPDR